MACELDDVIKMLQMTQLENSYYWIGLNSLKELEGSRKKELWKMINMLIRV